MVKLIRLSPQKRQNFLTIQPGHQPLNLILNVASRWNSIWVMLVLFRKLRESVKKYILEHGKEDKLILFARVEWRHIEYLIEFLKPFYSFTSVVSRVGKVSNHPLCHPDLRPAR